MKTINRAAIFSALFLSIFLFSYTKNESTKIAVETPRCIFKDSINTEAKAISYAESVLFKTYGKNEIENEKPYKIYQYKNVWVISGTLPKGEEGGTFYFSFYANDGKIITLIHGK